MATAVEEGDYKQGRGDSKQDTNAQTARTPRNKNSHKDGGEKKNKIIIALW